MAQPQHDPGPPARLHAPHRPGPNPRWPLTAGEANALIDQSPAGVGTSDDSTNEGVVGNADQNDAPTYTDGSGAR
jgi:hypothetical protein